MGQKNLAEIIQANPGCVAIVDNDQWTLYKSDPFGAEPYTDEMIEALELASSEDDLVPLGDNGYGSGNCYGGDILQALAKIVGMRVQSV